MKYFIHSPLQRLIMRANSLLAPIAKRLAGKVVVITGGASGIGESAARLFVRHGAKVVIADVQDSLGKSLCEEINNQTYEESISFVHCNVTSDHDVGSLVDRTIDQHGKLDIMYSNAGITGNMDTKISSVNYADFKAVFDINTFGAFVCAKHASRVMIPAKRGGSIVFTASLASVMYGDVAHAYLASKHAVVGLTKNLCVELGEYGIRVNCISPFGVATPMMLNGMGIADKETAEKLLSGIANLKGEILRADDIAEAALYLGSDESKYVSGVNLVVDGGYNYKRVV